MNERTRSTISIMRPQAEGQPLQVASVLITPESRRKYSLMSEDCITLSFELATPVSFETGDYIDDELFGLFYIVDKQMPSYQTATGGYKYDLKFEAEYMGWRNHVFMLTNGTDKRVEAEWQLTDKLNSHLDELVRNVNILGYGPYATLVNTGQIPKYKEAHYLSYNGTDIISALNELCDSYECEWWVNGKTINLGKCETLLGSRVTFSLATNVENMTIQNDRTEAVNKAFVYGGTENIPMSYRRELRLSLLEHITTTTPNVWRGDLRISEDMIPYGAKGSASLPQLGDAQLPATEASFIGVTDDAFFLPKTMVYISIPLVKFSQFTATFSQNVTGYVAVDYKVYVKKDGAPDISIINDTKNINILHQQSVVIPEYEVRRFVEIPRSIISAGYYDLCVSVNVRAYNGAVLTTITECETPTILPIYGEELEPVEIRSDSKGYGIVQVLEENGEPAQDLYIKLNPLAQEESGENYYDFAFCDALGNIIQHSAVAGDQLTLDDKGSTLIPSAYYVQETDNPNGLKKITDRRLRLPLEDEEGNPLDGYILADGVSEQPTPARHIKEAVVVFDGIRPEAKLKVVNITEVEKQDHTEIEGETERADWQWHEYTIEAVQLNGKQFPFDYKYILPQQTLRINFLTPEQAGMVSTEAGFNLAGMTFEVKYNTLANSYTIVRNEDYGTLLPNDTLKPSLNDPFVLLGWDVRAMEDLGLIADAEERLLEKGREYIDALNEGNFTFECNMMSSAPPYTLYNAGQRARVQHGALTEDKLSRVIGYEFKLDKPYDTPKYTIGETQAYSRLAKIEREISQK